MSIVTFDTLKYANRLKAAGVPSAQAEAEAEALSEVLDTNLADLVTKKDLQILETRMDGKFSEVRGEMLLLKWMMGLLMAGVASLVLKAFF